MARVEYHYLMDSDMPVPIAVEDEHISDRADAFAYMAHAHLAKRRRPTHLYINRQKIPLEEIRGAWTGAERNVEYERRRLRQYLINAIRSVPDNCEISVRFENTGKMVFMMRFPIMAHIHNTTESVLDCRLCQPSDWTDIYGITRETMRECEIDEYTITSWAWNAYGTSHRARSMRISNGTRRVYDEARLLEGMGRWDYRQRTNQNPLSPAEQNARELLLEHLSPEQKKMWEETGCFRVISQFGSSYTIARQSSYNVWKPDQNGCITELFCLQHKDKSVPMDDQFLSQKLLLENNEAYFLKMANRYSTR